MEDLGTGFLTCTRTIFLTVLLLSINLLNRLSGTRDGSLDLFRFVLLGMAHCEHTCMKLAYRERHILGGLPVCFGNSVAPESMSTLVSVKFSCTASCENIIDRLKLITTSTLSLIKRSTVPTKLMFIARKTIKDVSHLRQFLPTGSPLMMFSELLCIWALCDQP